jgi:hypothetical protein
LLRCRETTLWAKNDRFALRKNSEFFRYGSA